MLVTVLMAVILAGCATTQQRASLSVNRTLPERMTDIGIEHQVAGGLNQVMGVSGASHRVMADAFRGELLLTGEVADNATKVAIENMVRSIKEVKKVHNYLKVIDKPKSQSHTLHENYLKTKFLSKLLATRSGIKSSQYHTVVRDDLVYMMGTLTVNQANLTRQIAVETEGVAGFVSLLTVLVATPQELIEQTTPSYPTHTTTPTPTPQGQSQSSSYINLYQNTNTP